MLNWNNMNQQLFTSQYTKTLSEIYPDYELFAMDYMQSGLPNRFRNVDFLKTIYFVLLGEYGASSIMSFSEDLFRARFLTMIHSYGPQLERELEIQDTLLGMTDQELQLSSKAIYNTSLNPSIEPTTDTLDELTTINQQNTTKHVRSKLDAYDYLGSLLDDDLISKFVNRFSKLFVRVLRTNSPLYYKTNLEVENYD